MASIGSAVVKSKTRHEKLKTTFRGHDFTAYVRSPANMDEEAAILAAGIDPETRTMGHHTKLLQEYCRRCVREIHIQGPDEAPDDVEPCTGTEFAEQLDDDGLQRDTDLLWMLYVWLGAAQVANIGGRADLVEAVEGKRIGSSTAKPGTQPPKPTSSDASSGDGE